MTWRSFLLIILLAMQLHKHADELVKYVSIYFQLIITKSSFKLFNQIYYSLSDYATGKIL